MVRLRLALLAVIALLITSCAGPNPVATNNALFAIKLLSRTITPGWTLDVWVNGDTAFVADDERGINIFDISDLSCPIRIDSMVTVGKALAVAYAPQTNLLLTLERFLSSGLTAYNYATKSRLTTLGTGVAADFQFIELSSDTIILAEIESDGDDDFQLLKLYRDASFGGAWSEVSGAFNRGRGAVGIFYGFELDGEKTYFAHGERGVTTAITDYSLWSGATPVTVMGNVDTPGSAREIALNRAKTHLFVADYQSGLQVIDVRDIAHPQIVGSLLPDKVNEVLEVKSLGDTAIFTDRYNGIFAADVSDPTNPKLIGVYDTPDPVSLFIRESDRTIFLADQELGLLIFRFR